MKWKLTPVELELKVTWKISRNESLTKQNFILSFGDIDSEIAPNIRYDETPERMKFEFEQLSKQVQVQVLDSWSNAFKNAVNNILLKKSYTTSFKGKEIKVLTSFSIPIMDSSLVKAYLEKNHEFHIYKLKITDVNSLDLLKAVLAATDKKIRIDANEGFKSLESYLEFERFLIGKNIELIEQPFPKKMEAEYLALKKVSKFPIIADESVEDDFDPNHFKDMFHGINVKLMKAGGISNALALIEKARAVNLEIMIGCMIETSLGISEAFELIDHADYIDLDGALLIKNDPYSHLFELKDGFLIKKNTLK